MSDQERNISAATFDTLVSHPEESSDDHVAVNATGTSSPSVDDTDAFATIDTPAFRNWFGNSKVLDEEGRPLVVYHGTSADFADFEIDRAGQNGASREERGFFFTDDAYLAGEYAAVAETRERRKAEDRYWPKSLPPRGNKNAAANIMPVYLSIKNPATLDMKGKTASPARTAAAIERAKAKGCDGLIIVNVDDATYGERSQHSGSDTVYVAFSPEQIKSALGNRGTFSLADPNILHSRLPEQVSAPFAPIYYSALARTMPEMARAASKDGTIQPEQALAWLRSRQKEGKFKADELAWSGVEDWLAAQDARVAVADIARFVEENGVQVQEIIKGEPAIPLEKAREMLRRWGWREEEIATRTDDQLLQDVNGEAPSESATKYAQYVLSGGENYRELLLILPSRADAVDEHRAFLSKMRSKYRGTIKARNDAMTQEEHDTLHRLGELANAQKDTPEYKSSHWEERNILAHIRFNDRIDAGGKRILFVEELQSDWGAEGKRKGFKVQAIPLTRESLIERLLPRYGGPEAAGAVADILIESKDDLDAMRDLLVVDGGFEETEAEEFLSAFDSGQLETGVPSAPFVTDTKAWLSLGIKRMIRYAAENGYDKIAFINGQQSADRYDLSQQVQQIRYQKNGNGTYDVWASDEHGSSLNNTLDKQQLTPDEIADFVGKGVADKIIKGEGRSDHGDMVLEGLDLKIGGEGMLSFYDKIVPQTVNEVLRKLGGGKAEPIPFDGTKKHLDHVSIEGESQRGFALYHNKTRRYFSGDTTAPEWTAEWFDDGRLFATKEEAATALREMIPREVTYQTGFTITPELRAKALEGLPLFSRFSAQRRQLLASAAAAAMAPRAFGAGQIPTAGKAEPIDPAVLAQPVSSKVEQLLRSGRASGQTTEQGLTALRKALQEIILSGPVQLRPLAHQIEYLLPKQGNLSLTVDDTSNVASNGLVELVPNLHMRLYTSGGRSGLHYETVLHESMHIVVAARYKTLTNALATGAIDVRGRLALEQFGKVWSEFRNASAGDQFTNPELANAVVEAQSSPDEFFVRSLTDPVLQSYLGSKRYEGKTLWQRFSNWVKVDLLGREPGGVAPSWLDAALAASSDLMNAMEQDPADFARLRGATDPESIRSGSRAQEASEQFGRWFGDSKVVDESGRPRVMYRGLSRPYEPRQGMQFWTDDAEAAAEYGSHQDGAKNAHNVVSAYLSVKNPFVLDTDKAARKLAKQLGVYWGVDRYYSDILDEPSALAFLEEQGYDGVILDDSTGGLSHQTVVTFRPEQVKSAVGNNGNFDPADPSFLRSQSSAQAPSLASGSADAQHAASVQMLNAARDAAVSAANAYSDFDRKVRVDAQKGIEPNGDAYFAILDEVSKSEQAFASALAVIPDADFALQSKTPDMRMLMLNASAQTAGEWQLTRFGRDGAPWGDTNYPTKAQAIKDFLNESDLATVQDFTGLLSKVAQEQILTAEFKKWFGESTVVDQTGRPLVVYHGTNADFSAFDPKKAGSVFNSDNVGFFFSSDAKTASDYAEYAASGGHFDRIDNANVMPAYVSIKNPMTLEGFKRLSNAAPKPRHGEGVDSLTRFFDDFRDELLAYARQEGNDGIVLERDGYKLVVAFRPEQIKSAIGNDGSFDPAEPSILHSKSAIQSAASGFDVWFGGSKVVDATGRALKVYHGTRSEFDVFDTGDRGTIHFTQDPAIARQYAENRLADDEDDYDNGAFDQMRAGSPRVISAYLSVKNPFDPENPAHRDLFGMRNLRGDWSTLEHYAEHIKATGFDGILVNGMDDIAVFSPEQIKSDLSDNVKSSLDDPSVMHSRVAAPTEASPFDAWFGNSKVIDEVGRPLKVFHGTGADIVSFDASKVGSKHADVLDEEGLSGSVEGSLFYFTDAPGTADWYAVDSATGSGGANVMPVYLALQNPLIVDFQGEGREYLAEEIVKAKENDHDGLIALNYDDGGVSTHYIAFRADQIKSAIGNSGSYDPANSDIRFSTGSAPVFYSALERTIPDMQRVAGKDGTILASQALNWLAARQKEGRFKADEMHWVGLDDWLSSQNGRVAVTDIIRFVKDNGVRVEEVMNGAPISQLPEGWALDQDRYGLWTVTNERGVSVTTPQRTKEQALEVVPKTASPTQYSQYVLPGGENYRELLLTLPKKDTGQEQAAFQAWLKDTQGMSFGDFEDESQDGQDHLLKKFDESGRNPDFRSSHWLDTPNVIAHVRFNERVDVDGKRVLFIEELQSDWGQLALKKGIGVQAPRTPFTRDNLADKLAERYDDRDRAEQVADKVIAYGLSPYEVRDALLMDGGFTEAEANDFVELFEGMGLHDQPGGIPAAPFITDTKGWLSLGIKRMIRYAAENGYDRVAFINGEQSANRYDLSKHVDWVYWNGSSIQAGKGDINNEACENLIDREATAEQLPDIVGKEVADKLIKQRETTGRVATLSGVDLKVGGEGMRAFYDKIVPQTINEILKKLGGGKAGTVTLPRMPGMRSITMANGHVVRTLGDSPQIGFDITDAMRVRVLAGLPMFSTAAHPAAADATHDIDPLVQQLADQGKIVLHQDASTLPIKGRAPAWINALTSQDGVIHVVANALGGNATGIVLHEAFHAGAHALIGSKAWNDLQDRLDVLYRQVNTSSGASGFWSAARERVSAGIANGSVRPGMEREEFGAYAIEEYAKAPTTLRKWVDDVVGTVKAWALRRFGLQLGDVTPAQLTSLAKVALKSTPVARPLDLSPAFSTAPAPRFVATDGPADVGSMRDLLAAKGESVLGGEERGTFVPNGISMYTNQFGSTRYVYHEDGKAVGALQVMSRDSKHALMTNVFTEPEWRGRGIASALTERVKNDFQTYEYSQSLSDDGAAFLNAIEAGAPQATSKNANSADENQAPHGEPGVVKRARHRAP